MSEKYDALSKSDFLQFWVTNNIFSSRSHTHKSGSTVFLFIFPADNWYNEVNSTEKRKPVEVRAVKRQS